MMKLSEEQQAAYGLSKSSVITAGAGAGKTSTMVAMIVRDIHNGIEPESILVCTFTNAAARVLQNRIAVALQDEDTTQRMWIGTIDALCLRLVQTHALDLRVSPALSMGSSHALFAFRKMAFEHAFNGLEDADRVVMNRLVDVDDEDNWSLLHRVHEGMLEYHYPHAYPEPTPPTPFKDTEREKIHSQLKGLIASPDVNDKTREKLLTAQRLLVSDPGRINPAFGAGKASVKEQLVAVRNLIEAYQACSNDIELFASVVVLMKFLSAYRAEYARLKSQADLADYLDVMLLVRTGLTDISTRFDRVYIDEAQDTNPTQLTVLQGLQSHRGQVYALGDANQSIYAFRGADVSQFIKMADEYKSGVSLSSNYRSQPAILDIVNALFSRIDSTSKHLVHMTPGRDEYGEQANPVEIILTEEGEDEAALALPIIQDHMKAMNLQPHGVCILTTSNKDALQYVKAARALGIPAAFNQRRGLLLTEEVSDLIAFLDILHDPDDRGALLRVLSGPWSDIPINTLIKLFADKKIDVWDFLREEYPQWCELYDELYSQVTKLPVHVLVHMAVERYSLAVVLAIGDITGGALLNVERCINVIRDIESALEGPHLHRVLARLHQERDADVEDSGLATDNVVQGALQIMTIHAAKGAEYPLVVFARSNKTPSLKTPPILHYDGQVGFSTDGKTTRVHAAGKEHGELLRDEETARLWYVACTRAEEKLLIVASEKSVKAGFSWKGFSALLGLPASDIPSVLQIGDCDIPVTRAIVSIKTLPTVTYGDHALPLASDFALVLPQTARSLSFTSLSSYALCQRRMYLQHQLGLQDREDVELKGGTGALEFGSKVHSTLERLDWKDPQPDLSAFSAREKVNVKGFITAIVKSPAYPFLLEAIDNKTLQTESSFAVPLGPHILRGRFDVYGYAQGTWFVVDYKSAVNPEHAIDYALQRQIYAYALMKLQKTGSVTALWLNNAETFTIEQSAFTDSQQLCEQLGEHINLVLDTPKRTEFPAEPQYYCRQCPGLTLGCPLSL